MTVRPPRRQVPVRRPLGPRAGLALVAAAAATAGLALAGCTSSGSSSAAAGSSAASDTAAYSASAGASTSAAAAAPSPAASSATGPQGAAASSGGGASRVSAEVVRQSLDAAKGRDIIRTADLTIRVEDVAGATTRAEDLTRVAGGLVFGEQSSSTPGHPEDARTTLTLKVPPAGYGDLLTGLSRLGTRLRQVQHAEDVTSQVVDVDSRLATQRRSVAQIRALLDRATTVGQVVQVEGELTRREADLESLEAQRKQLAEQTSLATVTVALEAPPARGAPPKAADHNAFVTGLADGWDAFTASTAAAATVVGAVLPFLVLVLLLALPAWLLLRPRRPAVIVEPTE